MIEILVTVVVLAIGVLAGARMQVEGMRFSQGAYNRSQAGLLAGDIIDRMRANAEGVALGYYDDFVASAEAPDPGCGTSGCDADELAAQDLHDWSVYLYGNDSETSRPALPSTSSIAVSGAVSGVGGGVYSVRLGWGETIGSTEFERSLSVSFSL